MESDDARISRVHVRDIIHSSIWLKFRYSLSPVPRVFVSLSLEWRSIDSSPHSFFFSDSSDRFDSKLNLSMDEIPSSSSSSSSSSTIKHSFHGKKLRYQQRVVEHSVCSLPSTPTSSTATTTVASAALKPTSYLTAKSGWKTALSNASNNFIDIKIKQVEWVMNLFRNRQGNLTREKKIIIRNTVFSFFFILTIVFIRQQEKKKTGLEFLLLLLRRQAEK